MAQFTRPEFILNIDCYYWKGGQGGVVVNVIA